MRVVREHEMFNGSPFFASFGPNNGRQRVHSHDFLEIEIIGGGSGYHVTAQGRRPARAGDVFVLRPGTWHSYEECDQLLIANTSIAPSALRADAALLQEMPMLRELLWVRPTSTGHYGAYSTQIPEDVAAETIRQVTEMRRNLIERPGNRPLLLGRLLTILGTVIQHLADDDDERELHPAVTAILQDFDAAPERDWRVDELADAVSLDPAYISRLFRQHLGVPPMTYLARVRAERAALLLANTTDPISRIGAAVGWPDPAYFTRRFRALFGLTPSQYRQSNRQHPSSFDSSNVYDKIIEPAAS